MNTGSAKINAAIYTILYDDTGIAGFAKYDMMNPPSIGARVLPINVDEEYIPNFSPLDFEYADTIIADATGPRIAVAQPWKNLIGMSHTGELTIRYNKGEITKMTPEIIRSFFLPILSDKIPTGKLNNIPARGEKAEIRPIIIAVPPSAWTYSGRTGDLEIVVENIAKNPINER